MSLVKPTAISQIALDVYVLSQLCFITGNLTMLPFALLRSFSVLRVVLSSSTWSTCTIV